MSGSEYLYTVAEVAVAFVGFASIILAIRHRSDGLSVLDQVLITWLIERGLAALGFALLPMLLVYFELPPPTALSLSSGLLSAYFLATLTRNTIAYRKHQSGFSFSRSGMVFRVVILSVMIPIQALAAVGLLPFALLGWYLLGVSWLLVLSGVLFATILTGLSS